jgi:periplasmic protein TonB
MLGATAAVLLLLNIVFRFWPVSWTGDRPNDSVGASAMEVIQLEEIRATVHVSNTSPPPPPNRPPVVGPDEREIEDVDVFLDDMSPFELAGPPAGPPGTAGTSRPGSAAAVQYQEPRPLRFVEPEYTREARRRQVRAEVDLEVRVGANGQVEDARVVRRYLIGANGSREAVDQLGYGLEEAALSAARRWLFRPAREGSAPVASNTLVTMGFRD